MTATVTRPAGKAVLIDLGGVLTGDHLPAAATAWGTRLGISQQAFLAALFSGSDDQVLTGRVSEPAWWDIVAARLHADPGVMAELRQDLASYRAALRQLAASPGSALFIDDTPGHVAAAQTLAWPVTSIPAPQAPSPGSRASSPYNRTPMAS